VKCYTKAISINPADENAVLSLCTVWIFNKKIKEATSLLQQFVMITPRSKWAWKQLGILELDDTPLSAITRFQTSLRIVHDDPDVWLCLGEAYAKEGKYVASLKAFDRAKELNPNELLNDFLKAAVYQKLGQHSEAIDCYESLLTRLPDESLKKRIPAIHGLAETRLHYARELHEQGCFGACLENLTTILTLFKENEFCNYSLYKVSGDACIEIHKLLPFMVSPEIGNLAQICHDLIVSKFSDKLIAKIIVP
jgi:tetratricopeptide (TPR) repeat protein